MKTVSHNERMRKPLLEYILIGVALGLFLFGFWAYKQIEEANNNQAGVASDVQPPDPGTVDEVDFITEGDIAAEQALDNKYDDDEATAGDDVESAADDAGGLYDETAY